MATRKLAAKTATPPPEFKSTSEEVDYHRIMSKTKAALNTPNIDSSGNPLTEPNRFFNRASLIGYDYTLGTFYKLRYSHPLIKKIMDAKYNRILLTQWELVPNDPDDPVSVAACTQVCRLVNNIKNTTLPKLLASQYDYSRSFGFSLSEIITHTHENREDEYEILFIDPAKVEFDTLEAMSEDYPTFAYVSSNSQPRASIPLDKCWYDTIGNSSSWYGISDLRPLVGIFALWELVATSYAEGTRMSAGVPYVTESENPDPAMAVTQDSAEAAMDWLVNWQRGNRTPGYFPKGLKPGALSVDATIQGVEDFMTWCDTVIRDTLGSTLGNLEDSGSRALGETFMIADDANWREHVEGFVREFNEPTRYGLIEWFTRMAGFSAKYKPHLRMVANKRSLLDPDRMDKLIKLTSAGLLVLTEEDKNTIRQELGLKRIEPPSTNGIDPSTGLPWAGTKESVEDSEVVDASTKT